MKRNIAIVIALAIAAGTAGCGKFERGTLQQLSVKVGTKSMTNDDHEYPFAKLEPGTSSREVQVTITNPGSEQLTISNVYLEEGGNPYISIKWKGQYDPSSFPVLLDAYDVNSDASLSFLVLYEPETQNVDVTSSVLVIENDDPDYDNKTDDGKFKIDFVVESVGPEVCINIDAPTASSCLDKPSINFKCVSGCSTKTVYIGNGGTDGLIVDKIEFASPSSDLTQENPPSLPIEIPPKGDPAYNPITFKVRYCPDEYYGDNNSVRIYTNDLSEPDGVKEIPISVVQSPALLEFSTDSPFGYLDFSAGDGTSHLVNIYNKDSAECDELCPDKGQCCGCPFTVKGVDIDGKDVSSPDIAPPDAAAWFQVTAKDPVSGTPKPASYAIKGGASVEFEVVYQRPAGHSEDRNGTMCIRYDTPMSGAQDYCVSLIAASQCELSLAPGNYQLQFNSSSPADIKEKPVVLVNSGSAPCPITHVNIASYSCEFAGVSEDFSLKDIVPGDTEIPAFSLFPIWVQYSPHSEEPKAYMCIEYVDSVVGQVDEPLAVTLKGSKEQDCAIPVADPGDSPQYANAIVGQSITLNGSGSKAGECGKAVYENGHIWYLLSKPEGSTANLNSEGGPISTFTPDVAGEYEIVLTVYDGTDFYHSDLATVTVTASEAGE